MKEQFTFKIGDLVEATRFYHGNSEVPNIEKGSLGIITSLSKDFFTIFWLMYQFSEEFEKYSKFTKIA